MEYFRKELSFFHLTNPSNLEGILKEGLRVTTEDGMMGKGIYLLDKNSVTHVHNLYSLMADYFENNDLIAVIEGYYRSVFLVSNDERNIDTYGFILCREDIDREYIQRAYIMNENSFRKRYIDPIIKDTITYVPKEELDRFKEQFSISFIHEKKIKGIEFNLERVKEQLLLSPYFKRMSGHFHCKLSYDKRREIK